MRRSRPRRGSLLLIVTILVLVVLGVVAAFFAPSMAQYRATAVEIDSSMAFFLAEAGLSHAVADLNRSGSGVLGTPAHPIDLAGGGYYTLVVDAGDSRYTVTSVGLREGLSIRLVATVRRRVRSIWDNALIAGPGQSGHVIDGNATIHGGLYVFGEYADGTGDVTAWTAVVSFSGTGGIKDNYEDLAPALALKILPLSAEYPLVTEVRLKNGTIDLSGTGTIGQPGDAVDGIYHDVGTYGGNQGEVNAYSENGTGADYDMPDSFTLPSLAESYYDVELGTSYPNYDAYAALDGFLVDAALTAAGAVRIVVSLSGSSLLRSGGMGGGSSGGGGGEWGVTSTRGGGGSGARTGVTGGGLLGGFPVIVIDDSTPAFTIQSGLTWADSTHRMRWTPSTRLLEVDGVLHSFLPIVLGSPGATLTYGGRATIYSRGQIDLHANLYPARTFPTEDVLGLMTGSDLNVGTGIGDSQLSIAAVLFAEFYFRTAKQTQIAGSVMASYFDMGTNVPQLFAVPSLKDNLPPGWMYYPPLPSTVYVESWRKETRYR